LRDTKKFKKLHLRIQNLERTLARTSDHRPSGAPALHGVGASIKLSDRVPSNQAEREDLDHELHQKLATITKELTDAQQYISAVRKIDSTKKTVLNPHSISDFDHYTPYQNRIA
jgi:hypothetical protein